MAESPSRNPVFWECTRYADETPFTAHTLSAFCARFYPFGVKILPRFGGRENDAESPPTSIILEISERLQRARGEEIFNVIRNLLNELAVEFKELLDISDPSRPDSSVIAADDEKKCDAVQKKQGDALNGMKTQKGMKGSPTRTPLLPKTEARIKKPTSPEPKPPRPTGSASPLPTREIVPGGEIPLPVQAHGTVEPLREMSLDEALRLLGEITDADRATIASMESHGFHFFSLAPDEASFRAACLKTPDNLATARIFLHSHREETLMLHRHFPNAEMFLDEGWSPIAKVHLSRPLNVFIARHSPEMAWLFLRAGNAFDQGSEDMFAAYEKSSLT